MSETETEIFRVQKAISQTNSQKLKNDYGKYLKKLYKRQKQEKRG